ncbi:PAS domain-containing sensor histidine kinase [Mangrovibacterium lignilyticum]|uniref:PAS domain-containing sensor histidine kinase n=1 Tax=Mangrovibacterium lignilyticum TaxID=2668052 RepID=UPI0013D3177C|nr:PAS domain-containing sensor histidine kinase [Mangrovibacterium lignilyticum]
MTNQTENLHSSLIQLSEVVQKFVSDEGKSAVELEELEGWLTQQLDKIRVSKLKHDTEFSSSYVSENRKQDSIWIFNADFEILHYAGMHGHLDREYSQLDQRLFIQDILREDDFLRFKDWFCEAIEKKSSQDITLCLNSSLGEIRNCRLFMDMQLSNPAEGHYVACLRCPDNPLVHLENYQSIIFENMPGIDIYLFDKDYRYLFAAGGEKKRFDYTNIDFVGKTVFEVYDKRTVRRIYPFYNKVLNGEKTEGEVRFRDEIYYLVGSPLKDSDGKTVAGILIAQNVTNDKLVEEQLLKSKEEAQKANQAKSIFIANMSHEIRTPLNAIVGFSEQLAKTELNDGQQRFVKLIQNASDHLMYLVGEVVFLFKLGMGKVYLENVPFRVMDILNDLNVMFEAQAKENGLAFEMIADSKLPEAIVGDPFRLRQILMNLLVNAIKYTESGKVTFRAQIKKNLKRRVELKFIVEDTGVGISSAELVNIFNVFEQGSASTPGRRTGAGLGLGICKRLVEMLKGNIKVKSKVNVGSTFTVELPFEKTAEAVLKEDKKKYNLEDRNLEDKHILIADDDDHNLLLAEMILRNWGTKLAIARNGGDALNLIESTRFDSILLDIHMPEKTGLEIIHALRSSGEQVNYKTPTLAVTANALQSDLAKYLKAGFDDYLIKPYKEIDLYYKLCNALGVESKHDTPSLEVQSAAKVIGNPVFDISELEQTANGDQEFVSMMIQNFVNNTEVLLTRLEEDTANQNFDGVGEAAHKALSSFRFFKLNSLVDRLERLEDLALRVRDFKEIPQLVQETVGAVSELLKEVSKEYLNS